MNSFALELPLDVILEWLSGAARRVSAHGHKQSLAAVYRHAVYAHYFVAMDSRCHRQTSHVRCR